MAENEHFGTGKSFLFVLGFSKSGRNRQISLEVGQILVEQMLCTTSADRHLGASAWQTKLSINIPCALPFPANLTEFN